MFIQIAVCCNGITKKATDNGASGNAEIAIEPRRLYRPKVDAFELSDREFQRTFRLNKELVENLIYIVNEFSEPVGKKSDLDTETKVCCD